MDIKVPHTFPIAPWNANLNKLFLIALEIIGIQYIFIIYILIKFGTVASEIQ